MARTDMCEVFKSLICILRRSQCLCLDFPQSSLDVSLSASTAPDDPTFSQQSDTSSLAGCHAVAPLSFNHTLLGAAPKRKAKCRLMLTGR